MNGDQKQSWHLAERRDHSELELGQTLRFASFLSQNVVQTLGLVSMGYWPQLVSELIRSQTKLD